MRTYGIKIHGSPLGNTTEHDGRWLKFYDPTRGKHGTIMSTKDPKQAMRFVDMALALEEYRRAHGVRPDGRPNRPLTAWTVSVEPLPESSP